jgi:hypothetical protein
LAIGYFPIKVGLIILYKRMPKVYVVIEFGCNSGYNDMYPPSVKVFEDKEKAYEYYESKKKWMGKIHTPKIRVNVYKDKDGETTIEAGGKDGAKRPEGVSIEFCEIE